jgi:hypothetical protein
VPDLFALAVDAAASPTVAVGDVRIRCQLDERGYHVVFAGTKSHPVVRVLGREAAANSRW